MAEARDPATDGGATTKAGHKPTRPDRQRSLHIWAALAMLRTGFRPRGAAKAGCVLALLLVARVAIAGNDQGTALRTTATAAPAKAADSPAPAAPAPPASKPRRSRQDILRGRTAQDRCARFDAGGRSDEGGRSHRREYRCSSRRGQRADAGCRIGTGTGAPGPCVVAERLEFRLSDPGLRCRSGENTKRAVDATREERRRDQWTEVAARASRGPCAGAAPPEHRRPTVPLRHRRDRRADATSLTRRPRRSNPRRLHRRSRIYPGSSRYCSRIHPIRRNRAHSLLLRQ